MTIRLPLLLALSLATLSAACGDDSRPPGDGGPDTSIADTGMADTTVTDTGTMDSTPPGDSAADTMGDGGCVPGPERTWLQCTDGVDNDCDGTIDTDEGCSICPAAGASEAGAEDSMATCTDGLDNDCDGHADCEDSDCIGMATGCAAETGDEALCSDGVDNDGDGRVDCFERGCATTMACRPATMGTEDDATLCSNGVNDDYDDRTDCDDSDCDGIGMCGTEDSDAACTDGFDNDGDGWVDCRDPGCTDVATCMAEAANCTNGIDDDMDGYVDCVDSDCIGSTDCTDAEAVCDDGVDEDMDGVADCRDSDCAASCAGTACSDTNWFGTCATGTCSMGTCAMTLADYDFSTDQPLLVVEIMANPSVVFDSVGEYAEVLNVSTDTIDVAGLTLNDSIATNTATVMGSRVLAPGERLVFVASADPTENGGIMNGVEIGSGYFNQGGDEVAIQYMGTDIHRVTYPGTGNDLVNTGGGASDGQSLNLDQAYLDGTTTTPTWCTTPADAANQYNTDGTDTDYGTPGAANLACP